MAVDINDVLLQLLKAALSPASVQGDAGSVQMPNLKDLIEVDKYLRELAVSGEVFVLGGGGIVAGGGGAGGGAAVPAPSGWGRLRGARFVPGGG